MKSQTYLEGNGWSLGMAIDYLVKEKRTWVLESSSNYVVTLQRQESLKFYSRKKNYLLIYFP